MSTQPLPSVPPPWAGSHFVHPVRVYWEDTDAGGIVFYGNYLKFMERARTEWLSSLGFGQEALRASGEGMFVVAETHLRYLQPARLDDHLLVTVRLTQSGRASLTFEQGVWLGESLLTAGEIRVGWVQKSADGRLRPGRIPAAIMAVLPAPSPQA